jgi:hypothetical protein
VAQDRKRRSLSAATHVDIPPAMGEAADLFARGRSEVHALDSTTLRHGSRAMRAERAHVLRSIQGRGVPGLCRCAIRATRRCMVSPSDARAWTRFRRASSTLRHSSSLSCAVHRWMACTTRARLAPSAAVSPVPHPGPIALSGHVAHAVVRLSWSGIPCLIVQPLGRRKTSRRTILGCCLRRGDY